MARATGLISAEIKGDKALLAALQQFPKRFIDKGLKPVLKESQTKITLPAARRDQAWEDQTGKLRRSLKVRTAKGPSGKRLGRGYIGYAVTNVKTKTVDAYYAPWVFLGAKNRDGNQRAGTRTLRRALYDNQRKTFTYVRTHAKKALPTIARLVREKTKARK